MATQSLTLYKDGTNTEVFDLTSTIGKVATWVGASSTPTFPAALDVTIERKPVGNMTNDRYIHTLRRSGAATARAKVVTSSAEFKISVAKDPTSGATLMSDAEDAAIELVSYIIGGAPSATIIARVRKMVEGELL